MVKIFLIFSHTSYTFHPPHTMSTITMHHHNNIMSVGIVCINERVMSIEPLSVSPENRFSGEFFEKKWVIIDLMIGFWQISNTLHLPISPSPHLHTPLLPYSQSIILNRPQMGSIGNLSLLPSSFFLLLAYNTDATGHDINHYLLNIAFLFKF